MGKGIKSSRLTIYIHNKRLSAPIPQVQKHGF